MFGNILTPTDDEDYLSEMLRVHLTNHDSANILISNLTQLAIESKIGEDLKNETDSKSGDGKNGQEVSSSNSISDEDNSPSSPEGKLANKKVKSRKKASNGKSQSAT